MPVIEPVVSTERARVRFGREAVLRARLARTATLLRRLAGDPATSDEPLRRELCRQYRDEIDQSLSALLAELHRRVDRDPDPDAWVDEVDTLRRVVGVAGSLPHARQPPELQEFGLPQSLHVLAARYERLMDLRVAVHVDPGAPHLSQPRALCVYGVARAMITQAVQCRATHNVTLALRAANAAVVIEVADAGDPTPEMGSACGDTPASEWELLDAFEEVVRLGGTVSFECTAGGTVRLAARMPIGPTTLTAIAPEATTAPTREGRAVPRPGGWRPTARRHPRRTRTSGAWAIPWRPEAGSKRSTSTLARIDETDRVPGAG